ncbi:hypothetical protein GQX74_009514 [Glossina fuscipes]|nr:hypothetical protein GQX74_009514 [Glossina fuscipes]
MGSLYKPLVKICTILYLGHVGIGHPTHLKAHGSQKAFMIPPKFKLLLYSQLLRLLQALVEADFRIHFLLLFLKIWAKHMQIVEYGNMSSYCLIILAIFYLQQPLENYNNLAILLPTKKLQTNCNEHLVQGVNYAFDVENFFDSYKSCDLSSVVLSPYLGSGIPRNDFVNESINFFEYHNQLLTMSQYFNKDPERLRIDTYLCVQDPFCLNQNVAKSINGTNTEYLEYCLANVFSIFSICQNNDNMTSRYHQKTHDRTFIEYRMDQTECLYEARAQNPLYSVVIVFGNGPSSANRFGTTTKSNETPTPSGKGFTFKAKITEDLTNIFLSPVAATKTATTGFNACAAAFRNTSASDSALKSANNVFAAPAEHRPISPATRRLQK